MTVGETFTAEPQDPRRYMQKAPSLGGYVSLNTNQSSARFGTVAAHRNSTANEITKRDTQRPSEEQQIRIARIRHSILIPLDGSPLDAHAVAELLLREVGGPAKVGDAFAEGDLAGVDPVGSRVAASWHPTKRLSLAILSQYLNCRF